MKGETFGNARDEFNERNAVNDRLEGRDYGRRNVAVDDPRPRQDLDEREASPSGTGELFAPGRADEYTARWEQVQAAFVDDPRSTVSDADALVRDVIEDLTRTFEAERDSLQNQWSQDAEPDTEALRVALQRYRSFFQRLLSR